MSDYNCHHGRLGITCLECEIENLKKERDNITSDKNRLWSLNNDLIAQVNELEKDKQHLLAVCEERRLAEQEWKRRAYLMRDWMTQFSGSSLWTGETIWDDFLDRYPDAKEWFE